MVIFIPATFGTAQFDNSFFDITDKKFLTFRNAHNSLITQDGELVTLTRETTTEDIDGVINAEPTETSDSSVRMKVRPIREQDRKRVDKGTSIEGEMIAFTSRSYDLANLGDSVHVEVDDIITLDGRGGTKYRVIGYNAEPMAGGEIFRKLFLRRIDA